MAKVIKTTIKASPAKRGRRKQMKRSYGGLLKMSNLKAIASLPHAFKRLGQKTTVWVNGAGSITSSTSDTGITFSSLTADNLAGCYQFGWSHNFQLGNVVGSTDFINFFDRYKISGIKYKIMFQSNTASVGGSSVLPIIHYCKDDDDATVPTALTDLNQKSNLKTRVLGSTTLISYYIKPAIAETVYQSGVASAYGVRRPMYINMTYPAVQHYGIKAWVNQVFATTANNVAITIEPEYYLVCRDPQ